MSAPTTTLEVGLATASCELRVHAASHDALDAPDIFCELVDGIVCLVCNRRVLSWEPLP